MKILYNVERIYHTWDKWECYKDGFFEVKPPKGFTEGECFEKYRSLLSDVTEFKSVMQSVITEWVNSCEHNLTNERMNRVAWMGQAALAYKFKIPSRFRGGYNLLTKEEQDIADEAALEYINMWMKSKGYELLNEETVKSKTEANLY